MKTITFPVIVPEHVTAALRPGETAMLDADTGEWLGLSGEKRRALHPADGRALDNIERLFQRRAPLRPITRANANALRSAVTEMSPNDYELLDEMRRFYERGGAVS